MLAAFQVIVFPGFFFLMFYATAMEFLDRKIGARLQNRQGPPWFQPVADFFKLVGKEVIIPTEKVIELVRGEKKTFTRKFYPGYVMVRMIMTDASWHLVQSIPKVTGFVGGKNRPTPMRDSEAERILTLMESRQEQPRPKFNFERGDEVRVIDGPFGGFNGVVEDVNYDKGKLRVSVSIFGRQTPVELDFVQVSKG